MKTKVTTVEHDGLAVSIWHDEAGTLHLLVNRAGGVVAQERGK